MSFPQFAFLPPEIQIKIWAFSLPPPRIVDLFAVPVSESLQPRFEAIAKTGASARPSSSQSSFVAPSSRAPSSKLRPSSISRYNDDKDGSNATEVEEHLMVEVEGSLEEGMAQKTLWTRTFIERIYSTPHPLSHLHICAEARRIVLRQCVRINADLQLKGDMQFVCLPSDHRNKLDGKETMYCLASLKGPRPYTLFNPGLDILFLQDPPRTLDRTGGLVISSLDILLRWCPIPLSLLRQLAVPYYTWRKTRNLGRLGLVREFESLEVLFVSFLGDGFEGRYRATWSDAVGGLWSHVEEVEGEVRADVETLRRESPGWRVPVVKVVRHRGVLEGELGG